MGDGTCIKQVFVSTLVLCTITKKFIQKFLNYLNNNYYPLKLMFNSGIIGKRYFLGGNLYEYRI
ncbi:hypothetical protein JCM1393_10720 [Clostridium carnis]